MITLFRILASICLFLACTQAYSFNKLPGYFIFEGGGYASSQGKDQNVYIQGLIGDRFHVTKRYDFSSVVGMGYLINGFKNDRFGIDYGVNVFNLSSTRVSGNITQEMLFTNLAYTYYVSHIPLYAEAKAYINTPYDKLGITIDLGIGPNFIRTSEYSDSSLDGVTLPDHAFSGRSDVVFSATAGLGVKLKLTEELPLEVGYRFFYLGEGGLNPTTNQIANQLKTGTNYAHALVFTLSV